MAKATARRLKVFQAQLGFFDTVVAAPSRAAALRAWGVHQDLFAAGQAGETNDEKAVAAALAHPETPLQRAVGSSDPFAIKAANLPSVPDAPRRVPAGQKPKAKADTRRKPAADRSALDAAEAALRALEDDRTREETTLRRRQNELDVEREKAQESYITRRKAAATAVAKAREAYGRDGGST